MWYISLYCACSERVVLPFRQTHVACHTVLCVLKVCIISPSHCSTAHTLNMAPALHSWHSNEAIWLEKLALSPILHSPCLLDIQNYIWLQLIKTYFFNFCLFQLNTCLMRKLSCNRQKYLRLKSYPLWYWPAGRRQLENLVSIVVSGLDRMPHCWLWCYQIKIASPFQRNKKATHRLPSSAWEIPFLPFLLSRSWKFPFQKAISHFRECSLWRMIALLEQRHT